MAKGILRKKGDWFCIEKANKRKTDVPKHIQNIKEEWIDQEVDFTMVSGAIKSISYQGEKITTLKERQHAPRIKPKADSRNDRRTDRRKKESKEKRKPKEHARAPYNFIPLNEKPIHDSQNFVGDKFHSDRKTGYIKVKVTNLTPLFIRQVSDNENNYGYGCKTGIPGSSFRGMIRTMCEILSFGKFGDFSDHKLYYRGSKSNGMKDENIKAGILRFDKGQFTITECDYTRSKKNTRKERKVIFQSNKCTFTTGPFGNKGHNFFTFTNINQEGKKKYTITIESDVYRDYMNDVSRSKSTPNVFKEAEKGRHPVFFQVDEKNGVQSIGFAKYHRVPHDKSIGDHLPAALKKSVSQPDLVQGLFGDSFEGGPNDTQTMIAGRLSFGDLMSKNAQPVDEKTLLLRILASPKPTTYQHYLEQDPNVSDRKNWNSDKTNIRGYKMYWHRKTSQNKHENRSTGDIHWNEWWDEDEINPQTRKKYKTGSHSARVKPISEGAVFEGKIWFQNLTELELGLLCMALKPNFDIQEGQKIAHKIGLGKPLGLGSIEITVESVQCIKNKGVSDSKHHFSSIFENHFEEENLTDLRKLFDKNTTDSLGRNGSIWHTDRLKELKAMMTWRGDEDHPDWIQKTRYMEIKRDKGKNGKRKGTNEYSKRPVLPKPTEVIDAPLHKFVNTPKKKTMNQKNKLLNLSNHPSLRWKENQREEAVKKWAQIEDMEYPHIAPEAEGHMLDQMVEDYIARIRKIDPSAIHIMGEMTFTFRLVNALKEIGYPCVASTTKRNVIEKGDSKISRFEFVRFRNY